MYKSFFSLLLIIAASLTAYAQETPHATGFKPALSLEPFFGLSKAFIPKKELSNTKTLAWHGTQPISTTTYYKDDHDIQLGIEGGFRTRLQVHETWGIKVETGFQQLEYIRTVSRETKTNSNFYSSKRTGSARIFYFYQSLEATYQLNRHLSLAAGGYAGTLLSSYSTPFSFNQNTLGNPDSNPEEDKRAGKGLRDTRLGLQASVSYLHTSGISATLNLRQDLKSIYTSDAQVAGPISPTSLSLTIGYRFMMAN